MTFSANHCGPNSTQNNNSGLDQYNFNGTFITNVNTSPESVLEKLAPYVAANALHNAKGRANRCACLKGTRGGFIEKLGSWVEDPNGKGHVNWVKAGAGVGKTAVAQTLCEKYSRIENFKGPLAAAYFFSRNDGTRNSMKQFVPTIAYQLARSPALQPYLANTISTALLSDPGIVDADWEDQFERLIREPCDRVAPELWETLPRLVIIDGLDECMDIVEPQTGNQGQDAWQRDGQRRLLSMIQDSASSPSRLPLRFLIFSRPEHTISNFLHIDLFPDLEQTDMHELRTEADGDIYLYLSQEFARLVKVRRDAHLDASWPGEEAIQKLTRMSDGHFIYVVTAVRYVMDDDPSSHPQERLDIILHPKPSKYPDLIPLDKLYLQILQPFIDIREQLLFPLLQLITPPVWAYMEIPLEIPVDSYRTRRFLAELLNHVDSRHISIILSRLRSVLYVPDDEYRGAVSVLHASFTDFLMDRRRSNDFHLKSLDTVHYFDRLVHSSFRVLTRVMLQYDQNCVQRREPPVIEPWAFNAWLGLKDSISLWFRVSGVGAESLKDINEFDVYRYVNMLNDRYVFLKLFEGT
ncbi:hypothetical protein V5O48_009958 [Marasmius crinis-equi]|uniref:Nephrocystin 3-like N-terminal domain-containing protein n=1 Tax=Marasmius crinis-equi TaxID=585013 RepID=A0ABR3F9M3_9AGAR